MSGYGLARVGRGAGSNGEGNRLDWDSVGPVVSHGPSKSNVMTFIQSTIRDTGPTSMCETFSGPDGVSAVSR